MVPRVTVLPVSSSPSLHETVYRLIQFLQRFHITTLNRIHDTVSDMILQYYFSRIVDG